MSEKPFSAIDQHVGRRIRMRRLMMDMSQTALGTAAGITFQQVQKYEKGANRVSASRLQQFSSILQIPVAFFFEGALDQSATDNNRNGDRLQALIDDFMASGDGLAIAKAFMSIKSTEVRRSIADLVGKIADDASPPRSKGHLK